VEEQHLQCVSNPVRRPLVIFLHVPLGYCKGQLWVSLRNTATDTLLLVYVQQRKCSPTASTAGQCRQPTCASLCGRAPMLSTRSAAALETKKIDSIPEDDLESDSSITKKFPWIRRFSSVRAGKAPRPDEPCGSAGERRPPPGGIAGCFLDPATRLRAPPPDWRPQRRANNSIPAGPSAPEP
jgi:hypothetical protein